MEKSAIIITDTTYVSSKLSRINKQTYQIFETFQYLLCVKCNGDLIVFERTPLRPQQLRQRTYRTQTHFYDTMLLSQNHSQNVLLNQLIFHVTNVSWTIFSLSLTGDSETKAKLVLHRRKKLFHKKFTENSDCKKYPEFHTEWAPINPTFFSQWAISDFQYIYINTAQNKALDAHINASIHVQPYFHIHSFTQLSVTAVLCFTNTMFILGQQLHINKHSQTHTHACMHAHALACAYNQHH